MKYSSTALKFLSLYSGHQFLTSAATLRKKEAVPNRQVVKNEKPKKKLIPALDFSIKEMQALSVTDSIETRIDQVMEKEIKKIKVDEDEAEAEKSGSGPCGLEKSCDVGLLQCGNGNCRDFNGEGYCVEPSHLLGENGYGQCSDDCDCIGTYKNVDGFYKSCQGSSIFQYVYETCWYGMCVYSGYRKVSTYDGVAEGEPCNVDLCTSELQNEGICKNKMVVFAGENNYCSALCYADTSNIATKIKPAIIVEADKAEVKNSGAAEVKNSGPGPCGIEKLCDVGLLQCENGSCKEFDDVKGYCVEPSQTLGNNGYDQCSNDCDCIGIYKTEEGFYSNCSGSTIYQYFYEQCSSRVCVSSWYRKVSTYNGVVEDEPCSVEKCTDALHSK